MLFRSLLGLPVRIGVTTLELAEFIERDIMTSLVRALALGRPVSYRYDVELAEGDVVLTERIDVFHMGETTIELPVMGIFEVRDGLIAAWRDYFDLNQYMSQLPQG
mgnify:CR=1 FL=1